MSEPVGQRSGDAEATSDHAIAEACVPKGEDLVSAHLGPGTSDPLAKGRHGPRLVGRIEARSTRTGARAVSVLSPTCL